MAQNKNRSIGMKRLALSNNYAVELDTFKDIPSDPAISPLDNETPSSQKFPGTSSNFLPTDALTTASLQNSKKKKAKGQTIFEKLSTAKESGNILSKLPTPPLIAIELIRPGRQKVQVPANAIESTLLKRMGESTS